MYRCRRLLSRGCREIKQDFADVRAAVDFRVCGGDVAPGVAAVQVRFGNAAVGKQRPEFGAQAGGDGSFFVAVPAAHG